MRHDHAVLALCVSSALVAAVGCGASAGSMPQEALSLSAPRGFPRDVAAVAAVASGRDGTLAVGFHRDPRATGVSALRVAVRRGPPRCPPGRDVIQARSASAEGRWGPIETLGPSGYDPALTIASEASGGASVAWEAGDAVNVARHGGGRRFEPAVSFAREGPEDGGTTAFVTSADGRAYLAFATAPGETHKDIPQSYVAVVARDPDGRWGTPRQVSGRPTAQPAVTVAPDGAVVVAWRESSFDADDHSRFGGVGAAVGSPAMSFAPARHVANARAVGVLLAAGRDGEAVLAWSGSRYDAGPLRYATRASKATAFGTPRRIAGSHTEVGASTLAVLDDGTALLAWPDRAQGGIRLATRPPGASFGRGRLITRNAVAPRVAVTGRTATIVFSERDSGAPRYVTVARR